MFEEAFLCTAHPFLPFASSFMWYEQFCPGITFYVDDFYFIGKPKNPDLPGATSILPISVSTVSNCFSVS